MIQQAKKADAFVIAQLAAKLWDSHCVQDLKAEMETLLDREDAAVFFILCRILRWVLPSASCAGTM